MTQSSISICIKNQFSDNKQAFPGRVLAGFFSVHEQKSWKKTKPCSSSMTTRKTGNFSNQKDYAVRCRASTIALKLTTLDQT